jgi:hypothetical protein
MLATIITICINVLAFSVGMYIGSIIFGKEIPEGVFVKQKKIDSLEQKLREAPMIRTFEFRNGLTKAKLVADVLKPCMVEFYHHWYGSTEFMKWPDNLEQLADSIMEWYHPESGYCELLLIASSDGKGSFQVDFTWRKAKPMFTVNADAVKGLEQYYKDAK